MTTLNFPVSQSLFKCWQELWIRGYFKFILPRIAETTLEGIRLDLSRLSLKVRNRVLNVGYEEAERKMARDFLSPNDSVLEIGGAIGFIGLFCQKKIGIKHYITVEANPQTVEMLKRNYALNRIEPEIWNLALGRENGTVELNISGDFWENSIVTPGSSGSSDMIQVPSATFQTLLEKANRKINVLIVDIEGAEQFIDFDQIPASIDKIIIELHPQCIGQEMTYNLIARIIGNGFRVAREDNLTFAFLRK